MRTNLCECLLCCSQEKHVIGHSVPPIVSAAFLEFKRKVFPQEKAFFDKFLETSRSAHSFFVFVLRNTHPSLRKFPTFSSNTHPFSNPGFLSARHPCTVVVACTRGVLRRYPATPFLRRRPHVHVPSAPARNLDQKNIFHSNNFLPPTHQQQCKQHTKLNTHRRHCTAAFSRHSAHSTPLPPSTGVPRPQDPRHRPTVES